MDTFDPQHPDPFGHATSEAGRKVAELFTVASLAGQAWARARARRAAGDPAGPGDAPDLAAADLEAARAAWAPALDRGWLADAGLVDVARAWRAAADWEHADPAARAAADLAEERMRQIHPYAMARFDARRAAGQPRTEAMVATVPDFALHPRPRTGWADSRDPRAGWADVGEGRRLDAAPDALAQPAEGLTDAELPVVRRLLAAVARLSAQSVADGRGPLAPEVAEQALRNQVTGAPDALIDWVVAGLRDGGPAPQAPARPPTVASSGPGAVNWPGTVHDAVAATVMRQAAGGRRSRSRQAAGTLQVKARRPSGPPLS
jgi:hypothetical protein